MSGGGHRRLGLQFQANECTMMDFQLSSLWTSSPRHWHCT